MSVSLTTAPFLQLLARSGLLSEFRMQTVLDRFADEPTQQNPDTVCDWLLEQNFVTEWQAEKLRQSRFRGFFLGPYKLLDRIARGAMSNIYAAEHQESGEVHALKVLPPALTNEASYLPRFQREAAVTQRLHHPNIVRVLGAFAESDGQDQVHFMAMELLAGRDLAAHVQLHGPLAIADAIDFIRQAASGLQFAHDAGLVHRDIKPGNLFLGDDGIVRLLDLGLAHDFDGEENLTRDFNERVLGTADYLAPEQAADSHTVDQRADIYSLGCSLYFLLTGQPPFTEGTLVQRLIAHQTKSPAPVMQFRDDVPDALEHLLLSMMAKSRDDRPASAGEIVRQLELLQTAPDQKPPTGITLSRPDAIDESRVAAEAFDVFFTEAQLVARTQNESDHQAIDPFVSWLERVTEECESSDSQDPRKHELLSTLKHLRDAPLQSQGVPVMDSSSSGSAVQQAGEPSSNESDNWSVFRAPEIGPDSLTDEPTGSEWVYWIMPVLGMSLLTALCVTCVSRNDISRFLSLFR